MKLKITVFALLLALAGSANAGYTYVAQDQFLIGLGGGYGGMLTYRPTGMPTVIDNNGDEYTAASLYYGVAYRADISYLWADGLDQYGIEVGYMGYPKNTYDVNDVHILTYKGHTFDLLAVFKHNYYDGWSVAADLGAAYVTQTLVNPLSTPYVLPTDGYDVRYGTKSTVLPEVAMAFGYNFSQHFGMDLSVHYVFGGYGSQNLATATDGSDMMKIASVAAGFLGVHFQF